MASGSLEDLIGYIYAASLDLSQWWSVAPRLAAFLDATSAVIQARRTEVVLGLGATANVDAGALNAYHGYYAARDPYALGWQSSGGGAGVFLGSELIDPGRFSETEFYQDYAQHLDIFHLAGAALPTDSRAAVLLAVHRAKRAAAFEAEDKARLERVLPHIARALQIQTALAAADMQRKGALEALDRLALGVALVGGDGRLAFANATAETLVRQGDGVTVRDGKVRARAPEAAARLEQAVRQSAEIAVGKASDASDIVRLPRRLKRALSALVAPLPMDRKLLLLTGASVVIFLFDPDASAPPAMSALRTLYNLTPAEARLLRALVAGDRISDYAERVGISINTANTQLKQVFAKTEVERQSDLIRLVLRDAVGLLARTE